MKQKGSRMETERIKKHSERKQKKPSEAQKHSKIYVNNKDINYQSCFLIPKYSEDVLSHFFYRRGSERLRID